MTPEAKTALINAGRLLRLQISDLCQIREKIQRDLDAKNRAIELMHDRVDEIEIALEKEDLSLPEVVESLADKR